MKKRLSIFFLILLIPVFTLSCSEDKALPGGVDVDLSQLSGVLAYTQVAKILEKPGDYFGKTIRITGTYTQSYFDQTGLTYHFVIVGDESLCCQSGLEFSRNKEYTDYPGEQTRIEVTGVFESYVELGNTYFHLAAADMTVLE